MSSVLQRVAMYWRNADQEIAVRVSLQPTGVPRGEFLQCATGVGQRIQDGMSHVPGARVIGFVRCDAVGDRAMVTFSVMAPYRWRGPAREAMKGIEALDL